MSTLQIFNKETKKEIKKDWRIELARLISIVIIIIYHILIFTNWVDINNWYQTWPIVVAIGCFMYCSGNVHGLKKEFNEPGSLSISNYLNFVKKRFIRLYFGYYLGLFMVFIIKYICGKLPVITPFSLFLDLTSLWPLITGNSGGIWPEGWFICDIFILSLIYPLLRRLKKQYLSIIIIVVPIFQIMIMFSPFYKFAYFFPFFWTTEFIIGMLFGDNRSKHIGIPVVNGQIKKIIVKMGNRVWPLYLAHMALISILPLFAPWWMCVSLIPFILLLTEGYYHLLNKIYNLTGYGYSTLKAQKRPN